VSDPIDEYGDLDETSIFQALDDHDDVQGVYANFDVPDSVMAELETD